MAYRLGLMVPERVSKALVEVQRDDWLRQLVEISPKNVGSIVYGIACPV